MSEELDTAAGLLQEEKFEECLEIVNKLVDSDDSDTQFNSLNLKGLCLISLKRAQEAVPVFVKMIELDHSFEDAYYKKAAALDELGQLDEALAAYKETITKNYMLPESNFYSGVILQKQHHYDEALKMYDEALKYKDNAPPNGYQPFSSTDEVFQNKGVILYTKKEFAKAITALEESLKVIGKNEKVFNTLGKIHQAQGHYEKAIEAYDQALKLVPNYPAAVISKGQAYKDQHRYDDALTLYNEFLKVSPTNCDVVNEKGGILFYEKKFKEAIECFDIVIAAKPNDISAYNNKGMALKNLNKPDEALKCLEHVIQQNPNDVDALINKGSILDDLKKYDEALKAYQQAVAVNPDKADVYNNIGITLKNKNDVQGALKSFEKAVEVDSHYILGYTNKAQANQLLGNGPQALLDLKKASQLLKDPTATRQLSEGNIKFIEKSVEKIIELESKFHDQAQELEQAMATASSSLAGLTVEQQEVVEVYKQLKKQKEEITNKEFQNIQKPKNESQSPTKQEDDLNASVLRRLEEVTRMFLELKQENTELKQDLNEIKEKQEQLDDKIEEVKDVLEAAGVYQTAKIKEGWEKFNCDRFRTLYDYTKAFYWTLLNYFDAYRVASTGAVKVNEDHTEDTKQKIGVTIVKGIASQAAKLASNLPIIGSIIGMINKAVDAVYSKVKAKRFEERMNAIVKILMTNEDRNAQMAEDQSRMLAMAALEIADRKKMILEGKETEAASPPEKGSFGKAMDWIKQKVADIQAFALGEKIEIYSSVGGKEALQDIILLLAYMTNEHEEIVQESKKKPLFLIISDAVIKKKTYEAAANMNTDEFTKDMKKDGLQNVENAEGKVDQTKKDLNDAKKETAKVQPAEVGKTEENKSNCCNVM